MFWLPGATLIECGVLVLLAWAALQLSILRTAWCCGIVQLTTSQDSHCMACMRACTAHACWYAGCSITICSSKVVRELLKGFRVGFELHDSYLQGVWTSLGKPLGK
jgi:hypothetical protein